MTKLTDLFIRNLPIPETGQKTYWEKGFGIRVSQGGSKTFVLKHQGKLITLGKYPDMSLKTARSAALHAKVAVHSAAPITLFPDAFQAFLAECEGKNRPSTVEGYYHRLKGFPPLKLSDLKVSHLPNTPQHLIAAKVFFNWCIRNNLVVDNPFTHYKVKFNQRSRLLTDNEIVQIWKYDHKPYSDYLKLGVLTGQRRGQWKDYELREDTIFFPAHVMKNGYDHTIPLTGWTRSLLPIMPFNGWSKAKARLDQHVPLPHWTVHDLRRYFSTTMASLQVPLHVTEHLLSHRSGTVSGVAAVYNLYNFLPEARAALTTYEHHVRTHLGHTT